jgi:Ca-activated chloride channel family protein
LWATRKIGNLLNHIRLQGADQETVDQIVHLSIRYGIVTPYTSYLVTETMPLGMEEQSRISDDVFAEMEAAPAAPAYGQVAVEAASEQGAMADADAPSTITGAAAEVVRNLGSRTFVYTGEIWIDTAFDPDTMEPVEVNFLSDDYFALADARPELAAAFALGDRVIALADGVAYEVVSTEAATEPVVIPDEIEVIPPDGQPSVGNPGPQTTDGTPDVEPEEDGQDSGSQFSLPCLNALFPLALLPMVVLTRHKKKK